MKFTRSTVLRLHQPLTTLICRARRRQALASCKELRIATGSQQRHFETWLTSGIKLETQRQAHRLSQAVTPRREANCRLPINVSGRRTSSNIERTRQSRATVLTLCPRGLAVPDLIADSCGGDSIGGESLSSRSSERTSMEGQPRLRTQAAKCIVALHSTPPPGME